MLPQRPKSSPIVIDSRIAAKHEQARSASVLTVAHSTKGEMAGHVHDALGHHVY
jgi:hypothetical protein